MGKTFEALQRAEKEKQIHEREKPQAYQRPVITNRQETLPVPSSIDHYEHLTARLISPILKVPIRKILFTGTNGTGSSAIAVRYAVSMALDSQSKILLVDAKLSSPNLHEIFGIDPAIGGLTELMKTPEKIETIVRKGSPDNLYVLTSGLSRQKSANPFKSYQFDHLLDTIGNLFDYVIIDSPPVLSTSVSCVIGPKVDGTILVVESGKTRRQVALRAKKELEDADATILGVILNNRKYYIPKWLYKKL